MKLHHKQKVQIALGIAVIFILYGLLSAIFKFKVNPKIESNVGTVLMVIAFGLIFSGRKVKQDNPDKTQIDSSIQDTSDQLEINSNEQDSSNDNMTHSALEESEKNRSEKNIENK